MNQRVLATELDDAGDSLTRPRLFRDLIQLTKPMILLTCLIMTGAGLWLSPIVPSIATVVLAMVGTGLAVGGANALNMYWERDVDRLMQRTRKRPLPGERLSPGAALTLGLLMGAASFPILWMGTNPLTAALSTFAITSYVLVYTPLKKRSPLALFVGAIPGAMPALIGWTAATESVGLPGLVLFGIVMLWQLPHFLAIGLYRQAEYGRAGFKIVPIVCGAQVARRQTALYTAALVVTSALLVPLGVAGFVYLAFALAVGAWLFVLSLRLLNDGPDNKGARRYFLATLAYLPAIVIGLFVDSAFSAFFA